MTHSILTPPSMVHQLTPAKRQFITAELGDEH
jgi:hypothetical protein